MQPPQREAPGRERRITKSGGTAWLQDNPTSMQVRSGLGVILMYHPIDSTISRHVERGARILVSRGTATATEALLEIARRIGGLAAIVAVLNEIETRPRPPRRRRGSVAHLDVLQQQRTGRV
jgi:hypothetical protein